MIIDHIGLAISDPYRSRQFYEVAIAAGAKGNGNPGIREEYHP